MGALTFDDVTACIVTRGDVDLQPILDTLPYRHVVVWDNSRRPDFKCAGRYAAIQHAHTDLIYFQDDDIIFRHHQELLDEYEPGLLVANWAHGDTPDGYQDVALVGAGALVNRHLPFRALSLYLATFRRDDGFFYEADFIVGTLTPHKHVRLPFEIRDVAYNGRRLADQPWQRDLKRTITDRARQLR